MPNDTNLDPNRYTDGELRRNAAAYAVEHITFFGWGTKWTIIEDDGTEHPEIFDSVEAAQAALDELFAEIQSAIDSGERDPDTGYDESEFRIVEAGAE